MLWLELRLPVQFLWQYPSFHKYHFWIQAISNTILILIQLIKALKHPVLTGEYLRSWLWPSSRCFGRQVALCTCSVAIEFRKAVNPSCVNLEIKKQFLDHVLVMFLLIRNLSPRHGILQMFHFRTWCGASRHSKGSSLGVDIPLWAKASSTCPACWMVIWILASCDLEILRSSCWSFISGFNEELSRTPKLWGWNSEKKTMVANVLRWIIMNVKPVNLYPRFGDLMSSETSARSLCRRMVCPVVKFLGHKLCPCSLGKA